MRIEKDGLGQMQVPDEAYYGIMTMRSTRAYDIGPRTLDDYPEFIKAVALCKIACARANSEVKALKPEYADAIEKAAREIIAGKFKGQFTVNIFRGPGTPLNMGVNEVIAHRANEILTGNKVGPITTNTHVNMSQSTGDVAPTAKGILVYEYLSQVSEILERLATMLEAKAREYADAVKMGRTLAQDALPVTFGMTFSSYAHAVNRCVSKIREERSSWNISCLGGTAIGTGMGAQPGYREIITGHLSEVLGRKMKLAENLPETMGATDDLLRAYSQIECAALVLWRMGRDLMFMSSGPRCGLGEIDLEDAYESEENRRSIPDCLIGACEKVIANQAGLVQGLQSGWLEMGATSGVPFKLFIESSEILMHAVALFEKNALAKMYIHRDRCLSMTEESTSLATMVSTLLGYEVGTKVAHYAIDHDVTCKEAAKALKVLPDAVLDELFNPLNMTDGDKLEALFEKYKEYRRL